MKKKRIAGRIIEGGAIGFPVTVHGEPAFGGFEEYLSPLTVRRCFGRTRLKTPKQFLKHQPERLGNDSRIACRATRLDGVAVARHFSVSCACKGCLGESLAQDAGFGQWVTQSGFGGVADSSSG